MLSSDLPPLVPRWLSILRMFRFSTNPIPILNKNFEDYGSTYSFHIGGLKKGIATRDPRVIQHVLQKNNRNYRKSNITTGILKRYVGNGLLTSEGNYWLQQRRLIQPGFHRQRLERLATTINEEIDQFLQHLSTDQPVNVSQIMQELAFKIVASALFSTSVQDEKMNELRKNLEKIQEYIITQVRQPYLIPWMHIRGDLKNALQLADKSKDIIRGIIAERKESGTSADDLLQMLLDSRYEDSEQPMSDDQLLDECLILFIAGHETSANALAWTFYLLAENQSIQTKLGKEIQSMADTGSTSVVDLTRATYTRQVIDESLRMYPPAWVLDRVSIEDDEVNGLVVPAGSMLILYTYGVHHDGNLWNNPRQFIPERFDKEKKIKPFAYLPFGGGPRLCIGNNFALMEMQLVVIRFLEKFCFMPTGQVINFRPLITLQPDQDILLQLEPRTPGLDFE